MKAEFCESFVIYARSYKETSLLLDILTNEYGMVSVIANGARKNTSKFGTSLQPFYFNKLKFYGKRDLQTLQVIEPISYHNLGLNNICGLYLNELLYRLLPKNDPCPRLFDSYKETIINLAQNNQPQKYLRLFEKQIFTTLGYGLDFSEIVLNKSYIYRFNLGFVESSFNLPNSISGKSLLSFKSNFADELYIENFEQILQEIKSLMRMLINYHLGTKRLYSKEVLI